ncbi:tryptase-2 [Culex quinquefasciatus]|uniref:Tryptase-2 n=1 Tax=Culex quinquefasciatus TaxID=7176 RepID=B0XBN0_CULQU|nr:tryptase-2 [Culex quinquefasciatus]|eukprot:XP_001867052.1 tryptase-2 [Culex quinquefasciatus]
MILRSFLILLTLFHVNVYAAVNDVIPIPRYSIPHSFGKVINGKTAETGQFPWQVSIRAALDRSVTVCGGSLIAPQWILTAAHCAKDYTGFQIGFGSNLLNVPRLTMSAVSKIVHPEFDPVRLNNDVAVIKLPSPVPFSWEISPIQLPPLSYASKTFQNAAGVVSGFGRTSDASQSISALLKYETLRIISNAECSTVYGTSVIRNSTMCAVGWERTNQNVCQGDSGGPLVIEENGTYLQIGVVSFVSNRGCSTGDPSGYIRTASYLEWIAQQTGVMLRT